MNKFFAIAFAFIFTCLSQVFAQPATLDQSFGNKGVVINETTTFNMYPKVALQTDGKIVVATDNSSLGFIVVRYNKNGSVDSSFGVNGMTTKNINPGYDYCGAIAIQPDGKILAGGRTSFDAGRKFQFAIIRFNPNGEVDSSFATNGVHTLPVYNVYDAQCTLSKITVKPGGEILVGGHANNSMGISYFCYEQLKSNGSLDNTFGSNGSFISPVFWNIDFNTAIDSSNKIIAGGMITQYDYFGITRYNNDGKVDSSFGYNGFSDVIPKFRCRDVLVEPDGRIVFYGQLLTGGGMDYQMVLARFDPSGKLDRSFGDTGVAYESFNNLSHNASALLRQADGKYLAIGWESASFIIRYNHDGTIDTSFGKKGMVTTTFPGAQLINGSAALQDDGKVILAGTASFIDDTKLILHRYEKNALTNYNLITGAAFLDKNRNRSWDVGEPNFTDVKIFTTKVGRDTITTQSSGNNFQVYIDTGSYSTTVVPFQSYYSSTPASHTTINTKYFNNDSILFAIQPIPGKRDASIQIVPLNIARPGFPVEYLLFYKNQGTDTITTGTIELIKSSKQNIIGTFPSTSYLSGDTLRWRFADLKPMDTASIRIYLSVKAPPVANSGDTMRSIVKINSLATDLNPADNTASLTEVLRGSFDPNDKIETHGGKASTREMLSGGYLNYTIRFQNTGSDTAFNIYIRDTLSNKLDWNSFEMVAASSNYQITMNDGACTFTLNNINLVDSNTNEHGSHGYVTYRIKPKAKIAAGDIVVNKADIYFDYNLPVSTNKEQTLLVPDGVMALTILNFIAKANGSTNLLQWSTANEVNVNRFEVERSTDGLNYKAIGIVKSGLSKYDFIDGQPLTSLCYYRLKIINKDNQFEYSVVRVVNNKNRFYISVSPNPANEKLQVKIESDKKLSLQLLIISQDGKVMSTTMFNTNEGVTVKPINTDRLQKGQYYLKIFSNEDRQQGLINFQKL